MEDDSRVAFWDFKVPSWRQVESLLTERDRSDSMTGLLILPDASFTMRSGG
jgi:hypothetical protein